MKGCDDDEFPHKQYTYSEKVRHSIILFFAMFLRAERALAFMSGVCGGGNCIYAAMESLKLTITPITCSREEGEREKRVIYPAA